MIVVAVKTPMAPSGLRVTSVTHDNISLAWDASQSKVVRYIIVLREASNKKFRKVATVDGSELTCSLTTGFEQNQDYIFRVYAENEVIIIFLLLCRLLVGKLHLNLNFAHSLFSVSTYPI